MKSSAVGLSAGSAVAAIHAHNIRVTFTVLVVHTVLRMAVNRCVCFGLLTSRAHHAVTFAVKTLAAGAGAFFGVGSTHIDMPQAAAGLAVMLAIHDTTF